jgi:hypothetical protein
VTAFDKRPATTSKRPRGCAVCCLTLLARTRPTGARRGVQNTAIWAAGPPAVLDATVALLEEGMDLPEVVDIAERAAVAVEDVARADQQASQASGGEGSRVRQGRAGRGSGACG